MPAASPSAPWLRTKRASATYTMHGAALFLATMPTTPTPLKLRTPHPLEGTGFAHSPQTCLLPKALAIACAKTPHARYHKVAPISPTIISSLMTRPNFALYAHITRSRGCARLRLVGKCTFYRFSTARSSHVPCRASLLAQTWGEVLRWHLSTPSMALGARSMATK